eukprot:TRINITY_DN18704_c0_g1_i2.p1 TRINITY_DN18704_c0_g1~~TRINITY_DN18704_c0_g1_i2.p1  ORF type:complete len:368 (+),score=33.98 TRINITY_DN18704_c0_g1_i2:71-1174(+)
MVIRASQRWTLSLWLLEQLHPGASAQGVQPAVPAAAGPAAVSSVPTLATRPSQGFPGATPEASNAAWSTGAQPQALEAWPRAAMAALAACPEAAVLQDVSSGGWLGRCGGLIHDIQSDTQDACGTNCRNDPQCAVWIYTSKGGAPSCYSGYATSCDNGLPADVKVLAGQRLQHGRIHILRNITDFQVLNLQEATLEQGNEIDRIAQCRELCYSTTACQYWQYGGGSCRLDAPPYHQPAVQYPLTTNGGTDRSSQVAKTLAAGEYLQHYCPSRVAMPASQPGNASAPLAAEEDPSNVAAGQGSSAVTTPFGIAPSPERMPVWVWALLGLALLVLLGVAAQTLIFQPPSRRASSQKFYADLEEEESDDD